ncbi:SGNH/GDSL hydrolase family protein [Salidesulfovibrio brasiliensis]|uniref:SGNH/GDSL hydrolase family protein n=1 Tax=Salidesulfovibrio brasiliensis TaxID=221711 RepID=UPI0006D24F89|nr:SGNH/GDSL hydrolase family protein [Salidesulfovibrio brasiliensis]
MLKNILLTLVSILFCLLVLELTLHFLPVDEGLRTQPVNESAPIYHFEPNRVSTWSRFPDFSMRNEVRTNNYGFLNDQDYTPDGELPVLAVIGDSYVEAAMVPYKDTLHGRLADDFKNEYRVYSFGVSGAPLSQYLAFAEFARDEFKPQKMVFIVVGNDFDESLVNFKQSPGFHYFAPNPDGKLNLVLKDYEPSAGKEILAASHLVRYLVINVRVQDVFKHIITPNRDGNYVGQTIANSEEQRVSASQKAVMAFLEMLPEKSGLRPESIIFVVDGPRPHLYEDDWTLQVKNSYFEIMRDFFIDKAHERGYNTIDMTPLFINDYKGNHLKFEYPKDGHWNARGHSLAAEAVQKKLQ